MTVIARIYFGTTYISCGARQIYGLANAGGLECRLYNIVTLAGCAAHGASNVKPERFPSPAIQEQAGGRAAYYIGSGSPVAHPHVEAFFKELEHLGNVVVTTPRRNPNSGNDISVYIFEPDVLKCRLYFDAMAGTEPAKLVSPANFFAPKNPTPAAAAKAA